MSLYIHPDRITHVLLSDGWHACAWERHDWHGKSHAVEEVYSTFDLDAYEYIQDGQVLSQPELTGAAWREPGERTFICCGVSQIKAVRSVSGFLTGEALVAAVADLTDDADTSEYPSDEV